jgi:transketolase
VRDIAALTGVPGLVMVEPSCVAAVAPLLAYCLSPKAKCAYIRFVSIPVAIPFGFPAAWTPVLGQGVRLRDGADGVVIGYGPVLLAEAWHACAALAAEGGPSLTLVDLPWLNRVDAEWLASLTAGRGVVTLDNHYRDGGQGVMIGAALAESGHAAGVTRIGVDAIPSSGANAELLKHHGLDRASLAVRFRAALM